MSQIKRLVPTLRLPVEDLRVTGYGMREFELRYPDGYWLWFGQDASVIQIEKFAGVCGAPLSEFLDLNHTRNSMSSSVPLIPKLARGPSIEFWRASESGH